MRPDPEKAWRAEGKDYRLKKGDRVFLSVSRVLPAGAWIRSAESISELGLKPLAYQGIEQPAPGHSSNVYLEALEDLYQAQVLVVVLGEWERRVSTDWALAELASAIGRGVAALIYVCPGVVHDERDFEGSFPVGSRVRGVETLDDLPSAITEDLKGLMA